MNNFKTIKTTKKAIQLEKADGATFWIQKRWMRADGTLTPAGQKSADAAVTVSEFVAAKAAEREAAFEAGKKLVSLPEIAWESEKAIGIDLAAVCETTEAERRMRVFFPKSMVTDNSVPLWMAKKNVNSALEKSKGSYGGSVRMDGWEEVGYCYA